MTESGFGVQRNAPRFDNKTLLTTAPTLAYYDPTKPTMVSADASSYGIGGYILQKQEDESWRPWPASDAKLVEIAAETSRNRTLNAVISFVKDGWPKYQKDFEPQSRRFWDDQDKISLVGGILTYGDRIVIPTSLRQQMLQRIHEGHQGISKSRLRANQAV
ncbi:uncharacterized protein K02A2.6-like [Patiria miniata]|uniref:Reverse transcriptase/retrotransposon-derived protein RNase H-like domain-containing protein n=1 Tax=Patiria miniata TaxID=46514 RepID=A0A914ACM4_PATMI|nr:uncharacterized protein K02A2.6-like [Patiria miniata]